MPRSDGARPPLGRTPHVGVVERHGRIEPKDPAALRRESDAELRLLPGDQILAITPDGLQRVHPDERIAAAGLVSPIGVSHSISQSRLYTEASG